MPGSDKFTLYIEKGVRHGAKLVWNSSFEYWLTSLQSFPNQGNEFTDMGASDISFVVIEVPHPRFKREGDNLRTTVEISLQEV